MNLPNKHISKHAVHLSLAFLIVFASSVMAAGQVRVLEGSVAESRRNDGFSSGLQVELKVVGDVLKDAKGIRVTIEKAIDETGKNLLEEKKAEKDFWAICWLTLLCEG